MLQTLLKAGIMSGASNDLNSMEIVISSSDDNMSGTSGGNKSPPSEIETVTEIPQSW